MDFSSAFDNQVLLWPKGPSKLILSFWVGFKSEGRNYEKKSEARNSRSEIAFLRKLYEKCVHKNSQLIWGADTELPFHKNGEGS